MNILISYEIQGEDHKGRSAIRDDYVKKVLGGIYVGGSAYWVANSSLDPSGVYDAIVKRLPRALQRGEWVVVVEIARSAWATHGKTFRDR